MPKKTFETIYALFLAALERRAGRFFLGATFFFEKNLRFFSKNNVTPKKPPRTPFERSEKQCVNRLKSLFRHKKIPNFLCQKIRDDSCFHKNTEGVAFSNSKTNTHQFLNISLFYGSIERSKNKSVYGLFLTTLKRCPLNFFGIIGFMSHF